MKVMLINGSPNENGCTRAVLAEIEKILEEEGAQREIFHIGNKPVQGCTACGKCKDGLGKCVFNDVNVFLERFEKCGALIVGSPVYYAGPNGALSAFLDRAFFAGKCFAYKPAAAVACARRAGTTAALDRLNKYFTISNMPVVSSQYWNMAHGSKPEDVAKDLEGLQTMRVLARNTVWLMKLIEAGKLAGIPFPKPEATRHRTNFIDD
ncbi:MAG: flavodoxin family protein [Endomicrobium sp.]|jgi:multimeric flavodoxin WrbA|nr:flavodoxin family protein [Endomicrobium sp.]